MKGRSSKHLKEQEPQLSGAYIRSLVKQLTSSRTSTMSLPKDQPECIDNGGDLTKIESDGGRKNQAPPPPPHKKQVRRRLHTTRPYQERLLNMAEARREIVTALKYHRAAMKQAGNHHHHSSPEPESAAAASVKYRRNPRIYPSNNFTSYNNDTFGYPTYPHQHHPPPPPTATAYGWPIPPPSDPLNFALPNQTLGLNLSFHDFNNIDKSLYQSTTTTAVSAVTVATTANPLIYSSSSSQSISITTQEVPNSSSVTFSKTEEILDSRDVALDGLYPVMDDEKMAEIISIGEKHQMEWNDTMNLMTSAWWFKFLKPEEEEESFINNPFNDDQLVTEFPPWLNINDQQQQQDCFHQDPSLPWLDIGDIEGMDGDWLS